MSSFELDDDEPILTTSKRNILLSFASKSRAGLNEYQKPKINQDIIIEKKNFNNLSYIHLFGVCDGHGQFGHDVSAYL